MRKFKVNVNGVSYNVEVQEEGVVVNAAPAAVAVAAAPVPAPTAAPAPAPAVAKSAPVEVAAGDTTINSPMPGKIVKVLVKVGDKVKKGDNIVILEAMKMQNEIPTMVAGTVKSISVSAGQGVKPGEVLAVIG